MRKIICTSINCIPRSHDVNTKYFSMYNIPKIKEVGWYASTLKKDIENRGLKPSVVAWDFLTFALSVSAADNLVRRNCSPDGWTRQIDLSISLCEPSHWEELKISIQNILGFLTGDYWTIHFNTGGIVPPTPKDIQSFDVDCISLLSGGVDSLVGAIDLTNTGRKPAFVSQIVSGNSDIQRVYANRLKANDNHFQWSHKINLQDNESEPSTRARSIVFFAFAAIVASALSRDNPKPMDVFVCENGFISLNIPLTVGRMGSLSTKTTHPVYIQGIQKIWNTLGINARLTLPYRFKTKGEMLKECQDQIMLSDLVTSSTSCGKYSRYGRCHCGRCVPCLVRRAAFIQAGITDNTKYRINQLLLGRKKTGADDVGAMALACLRYQEGGPRSFISGNLSFSNPEERHEYEGVAIRGLLEVERLLKIQGIL